VVRTTPPEPRGLRSFSPSPISSANDEPAERESDNARVDSYGVVWQENGCEPVAGKLELDYDGLRLEGSDRDHLAVCALAYRDLAAVRIDRDRADRLYSRPTLVLERSTGDTIRIAALVQAGIVAEIAERLAELEPRMRAAG
jgi:hypothetical protein